MAEIQKTAQTVSIVTVHYQTPKLIERFLTSFRGATFEIIIVDNSPGPEIQRALQANPQTKYISNTSNIGFAAACNKGITESTGEWILLLNSDTFANPTQIEELINLTIKNNAKVSAPALINNTTHEKNIGYFDSLFKHPINWLFARPRFIDPSMKMSEENVDVANGGAFLIHRSVIELVGELDEASFFMYFEDIDYCYRLKKHGIPVLFVPQVKIQHDKGQSADQNVSEKNKNYKKSLNNYLTKHRGSLISTINSVIPIFT